MSTTSSCPSCHGRKQLQSACAFCGDKAAKGKKKREEEDEEEEEEEDIKPSSMSCSHPPVPSSSDLSSVTENMIAVSDSQPSSCRSCRRRAAVIATSRGNFCSKACVSAHTLKPSTAPPKQTSSGISMLNDNMAALMESLEEEEEEEEEDRVPEKKTVNVQRYELFHQSVNYAVDWTRWYPPPGPLRVGVHQLAGPYSHLHLAYTQHGQAGPLVVLLPALGVSRYEFRDFQVLCAPFCRTVAIDPLNTGESSRLNEEERRLLERDAATIVDLLDVLYPGEPYHVVGSEWGGVTALGVRQGMVSLTLLNPPPEMRDAGISRKMQAINECTAFWESSTLRSVPYMGAAHCAPLEEYMKEEFQRSSNVPPYQYDGYLADRAQALSRVKLLPRHPTLNPTGIDLPSSLPTFLVYGSKEDAIIEAVANSLPAQYGLSTYVIQKLCDARHLLALDQPVALAQSYLHFLSGVAHQKLATPYLGFPAAFKGDEPAILSQLS